MGIDSKVEYKEMKYDESEKEENTNDTQLT